MHRITKQLVSFLLIVISISVPFLCLVSCDTKDSRMGGGDMHVFKLELPENFDSFSVEEQLEWCKNRGYLIIKSIDGKIELDNYEVLDRFLSNTDEEKELLIVRCAKLGEDIKNTVRGLFFDGESYHATGVWSYFTDELETFSKYEICSIEEYKEKKYIFVSNDITLSAGDDFNAHTSSNASYQSDFHKKYMIIATIAKTSK